MENPFKTPITLKPPYVKRNRLFGRKVVFFIFLGLSFYFQIFFAVPLDKTRIRVYYLNLNMNFNFNQPMNKWR
jgi:hypothetical protein